MNDSKTVSNSAMPPMIDTHCHLDDHQFADDLVDVLGKSREANVTRWVLIGYDPTRWDSVIDLASQHEGMFHTLGVHPACADQWNNQIAQRLKDLAIRSRAIAIGEAGLDFYRDNAQFEVQAAAFRGQLELALELDLPVIIHMRQAESEMLDVLQDAQALPTLIFHSFDGTEELLGFALNSGSYVGIGGLATRQKSDTLRALLQHVPMEQILLETDSPYLVPARQKERRNQPAQIATIASMMAAHLNTSPQRLAEITTANAERVFGLRNE